MNIKLIYYLLLYFMDSRLSELLAEAVSLAETADGLSKRLAAVKSKLANVEHAAVGSFPLHSAVEMNQPPFFLNSIAHLFPLARDVLDADGKTALAAALAKKVSDDVLIAVMPKRVTQQRYFQFNTTEHDLREIVATVIAPGLNPSELVLLHESTIAATHHLNGKELARHSGRMVFHKRWKASQQNEIGFQFRRSLGLFVEKVVAPLLYSGEGEEVGEVVYQRNPTLRVQMPGFDALGHRHNDYMYKRQPTETNVWIPLTLVGEGNTLYAESVPGKGDYAPFEAEYGTAVLFWGNQCSHYSTKNSTEDCTRVSFDLRVVRADDFIEDYVHPDANPEYSRSAGLRRGMHYTDTAAEREWRRGRPTAAKES